MMWTFAATKYETFHYNIQDGARLDMVFGEAHFEK